MTPSSDSSVTRCETCGDPVSVAASGDLYHSMLDQGVEYDHRPPATAPSSDPVNEGGRAMWVECAACNKGAQFIAGGELRRFEYEHTRQTGHGTFNVGPLTTPVLSPTEAGPVMVELRAVINAARSIEHLHERMPDSLGPAGELAGAVRVLAEVVVGIVEREEARRG